MRFIPILFALFGTAAAETLIVGNKAEHTVSFVDLETGREVARRETGQFPHEIAVSPEGDLAVVVSYRGEGFTGNTLHLFDVAAAEGRGVIDLGDSRGPHGLKWIPGTTDVIVTTEVSKDAVVVAPRDGEIRHRIATGQEGSHMVAVSPDGTSAYVANIGSGSFTVIDLSAAGKLRDVKAGDGTEAIAVTPDGKDIVVGNNGSRSVMVFDAVSFRQRRSLDTEGVPIRVEISPDGETMAVSQPDLGNVAFYRYRDFELLGTTDLGPGSVPVTLLFAPDGGRIWAAATGAARVFEIDTESLSIVRHFDVGQGSDGLAYSPASVIADD